MKAGDILWYASYDCTDSSNEDEIKCPDDCGKSGTGHFAMILGISYEDKEKTKVKYYYIAESANPGNAVDVVSPAGLNKWEGPKDPQVDQWGKALSKKDWNMTVEKSGKTVNKNICRERAVVKLGNLYNYYTDRGDTEHYTDLWF